MSDVIRNFVETPKGRIVEVRYKNGSAKMKLEWNKNFTENRNADLSRAQKYIDAACIRLMVPYTPMLNGILSKSAAFGTVIGSGEIKQVAPYARYQYYGTLMVSSKTGSSYATMGEKKVMTSTPLEYNTSRHPLAGKLWFERMKADKKDQILAGAAKIIGGKTP